MTDKKKELMRTLKFTLFSISAGVIQAVSFALLNELLHLPYWICNLIALVLALTMITNFVSEYLYQRFFVFGKSLDTAQKK